MLFRQLFDEESSTYTYLIADESSKKAVLVDSVLEQFQRDIKLIEELGLTLHCSLETHIHADHITATAKLREATGCEIILPENTKLDCADRYIKDTEVLQIGKLEIKAIATPGHTDSHMAYLVNENRVLTGDALFVRGCGRTDFQGGDAKTLYNSVRQRLFVLPEQTLVYPAHDYKGHTVSTIGEEKRLNPRFAGKTCDQFIQLMNNLDLPYPQKMKVAVGANQSCGITNSY